MTLRGVVRLVMMALFVVAAARVQADPAVRLEGDFSRTTRVDPAGAHALGKAIQVWDSRRDGDAGEGRLQVGPFAAPHILELGVAGFPGNPGVSLYLVRSDGVRLDLRVRSEPADRWVRLRWTLPDGWRGHPVTLVAEDHTKAGGGWIGISAPLQPASRLGAALKLALFQALIFAGLLLPGLAVASIAPARDSLDRWVWALVVSGLAAYLDFFAVFLHHGLVTGLSWTLLALAAALCVARWKTLARLAADRDFLVPLLIALLVCLFYSQGAFLYGGLESPAGVPMNRILANLPADPILPHRLADIIAQGLPLRPFYLDWLSSDRPPLQAALEVLVWPFASGDLGAALVGMAVQSWVWIGLWIFLRRLPLNAWQRGLVLVACVFSGFFFLNTIFYWPKLLPTAYLLAAASLLWADQDSGGLSVRNAVLAAACLALGMLGHGGSAFGIAGMAAVYLVQRGLPGWRPFLAGTVAAVAVMTPWTLYQKFADPPGNRLIAYHLADHPAIDPRPSLVVIREAYKKTPWRTLLHNKVQNVEALFCRQAGWWDNTTQAAGLARKGRYRDAFAVFTNTSRIAGFFHYGQTLACLLPGALGALWLMTRRRGSPLELAVRRTAAFTGASCVVWCLLMFGAGTTVIHQSSYFTGACLFTAVALGLAAYPRWLARLILGAHLVWFFAVWMLAARPMPWEAGHLVFPAAIPGFAVGVAVLCLGLLVLLHRVATEDDKA
ncbi:hypothetical protein GALL_280900 [mine drainage metagenome]|uniref:Uncharacterized protein n=1 Tax=mine drainage metagenome TaxID=410659 RepID=A0A1J5R221_9ZZZZ